MTNKNEGQEKIDFCYDYLTKCKAERDEWKVRKEKNKILGNKIANIILTVCFGLLVIMCIYASYMSINIFAIGWMSIESEDLKTAIASIFFLVISVVLGWLAFFGLPQLFNNILEVEKSEH